MTTTDSPTATPPKPLADQDSAYYWEQLRDHRIVLQTCTACGHRRFPPTPACPYCAHPDSQLEEVPGDGVVYSFIVVHRAFDPAFTADVPYAVATIDLDGGGRLVARMDPTPTIGARVGPLFVDHADWTELRFRELETS